MATKMIDLAQIRAREDQIAHLLAEVIASQVEISWYKNNIMHNTELWYQYHGTTIDVYFWW